MIERAIIKNYRKFRHLEIEPSAGLNVLIGDNDAGKSTVLEAINLALTGKVNGRWATEELNPFWFHRPAVGEFFDKYETPDQIQPPEILIELYFAVSINDADLHRMRGVHNSRSELGTKTDCPGVRLHIKPSADYKVDFEEFMRDPPVGLLPTEYYTCEWSDFDDKPLTRRPKVLSSAFIDSRTLRSSVGVDYHTRQILDSFLTKKERVQVAIAHRKSRHDLTTGVLASVSAQMATDGVKLHDKAVSLAMDQSSRASWESDVVPHVSEIPFGMSGQGEQAAVKVALAMHRHSDIARYVLIEEPETHQSYSSLHALLDRIVSLAGEQQQLFVTTHSSFVLNRLGLDNLLLLRPTGAVRLCDLSQETVSYFKHLSGYDTLRLVLGRRLVLVEGPSDEMVFARCFSDVTGKGTRSEGIDVVSMSGITFKRAFELCKLLDRDVVALQDNDGNLPADIIADLTEYLSDDRHMCIGHPNNGETLEPQLIDANGVDRMRQVLELRQQDDPTTWMPNHKTESALRILESQEVITFPAYILKAVDLVK